MSTLPPTPFPPGKHFTPFRSAAEEAATKTGEDLGSKSISEVAP